LKDDTYKLIIKFADTFIPRLMEGPNYNYNKCIQVRRV